MLLPPGATGFAGLVPGVVAIALSSDKRKFLYNCLQGGISISAFIAVVALTFGILLAVWIAHYVTSYPISLRSDVTFLGVQLVSWSVVAFGQELGWRAFALPRFLQKYSSLRACCVLSGICCLWHCPELLSSIHGRDAYDTLQSLAVFSVQTFAGNIILCRVYLEFNRSLWAATLYHSLWYLVLTIYRFMAMDVFGVLLVVFIATALMIDESINEKAKINRPGRQ
jgi:membrane protease YdiL (CAAX protease family)